ncbi:MAG TPA: Ldh family oxidoreductase [Sphingomonas sp.]
MTDTITLSLAEVRELAEAVLRRHGLGEDHVRAVSDTIVAGERDGCTSHGVYRLLVCAHSMTSGAVRLQARPRMMGAAPGIVRVDADGGFAQLAHAIGLPVLIERARRNGIAAMAINNCVHFAALWPDVEPLAQAGLAALAFTPSHAWVAPEGGTRPVFGTNPIAFAWPRPGKLPFAFDLATSAVARGEIELYRRAGKPVPHGWGYDADGVSTTDPAAVLAGAMRTFGGHKGSALATMVELIAGPLIGDMTSAESLAADAGRKAAPLGGELIIAIDPAGFLGPDAARHLARAEVLFDMIGGQGARLPGERRHAARIISERDGVAIDRTLHANILQLLD